MWWCSVLARHPLYWRLKTLQAQLAVLAHSRRFPYDIVILTLAPLNPNSPPLGAAYIHTVLKKSGYRSRLIDFSVSLSAPASKPQPDQLFGEYFKNLGAFEYWLRVLEGTGARFFGFSVWICNESTTKEFAAFLRSRHPEWVLIFGGPSCSRQNVELMARYGHYCVFNEGEEAIVLLLDRLMQGRPIDDIPNLYYEKDGKIVHTAVTEGLVNMDALPYPDFSHLDLKRYRYSDGTLRIPIQFSRGCIANCSFCTNKYYHRTQRSRTGSAAYNEILHQMRQYGTNHFLFVDDSLISWKTGEELARFCQLLIDNHVSIDWVIYATRVDRLLLKPGYVPLLAASGLSSVTLGVESFSDRVLRHMGKASNRDTVIKVIGTFKEAGVRIGIFLIYGYPVETQEDFELTLAGLKEVSRNVSFVVCNVFHPNQRYMECRRPTGMVKAHPHYEPAWTSSDSDLKSREVRFFRMIELLQAIKEERGEESFSYILGDAHNLLYLHDWNQTLGACLVQTWKTAPILAVEKEARGRRVSTIAQKG